MMPDLNLVLSGSICYFVSFLFVLLCCCVCSRSLGCVGQVWSVLYLTLVITCGQPACPPSEMLSQLLTIQRKKQELQDTEVQKKM